MSKDIIPRTKKDSVAEIVEKLRKKIRTRDFVVGIIGMGYVGLPLARTFLKNNFSVIGFDIDPHKIKRLNRGESYIHHIPSDFIKTAIKNKKLQATDSFSKIKNADAVIICVPTPLTVNREPDLNFIINTAHQISNALRKEHLIVLESTTYPGTTDEVVKPILEETGLKAGKDFFLAFSPEREDPGNPDFSTEKIPKVVGGYDEYSLQIAAELYSSVVPKVVKVSSTRVAEATKLLENIYRCVNIALVNEMKVILDKMDIDVWEVIKAASTKPFGFHPFYPGPGLGGHCIPVDPFYLTWKARQYDAPTRFIELAGEVNSAMPYYVIQKVQDALNKEGIPLRGAKILIIGIAYKKDVDDIRESPALKIIHTLIQDNAIVQYHDPFVKSIPEMRRWRIKLDSKDLTAQFINQQDCVLIVTNHSNIDYKLIADNARLVVDTRNAMVELKNVKAKIVKA